MNKNVKLRRIFAWMIDWNLSGLPCLFYTVLFMEMFKKPSFDNSVYIIIFVFLVFTYPVIFVFRDIIFGGRSIGKRIFKLYVLDKISMESAKKKQKILRNVFFFTYPIDGLILISTGESIGDRVANTIVLRK